MIIFFFFFLFSISSHDMDHDHLSMSKTIHCIQYKKLSHNNPLMYHLPTLNENQSRNEITLDLSFVFFSNIQRYLFLSVSLARQSLVSLFECIFPNDVLLCEYLLLHLLSRTYVRQPSSAYGKLSLNLSHISSEQYAALEQVLQMILPLHSHLALTVNTLNTMQLMPNKNVIKDDDNSQNKLMRTPLQLPFNSHLLMDERQMECGQLTTLGR
jgi:hypothetical protein